MKLSATEENATQAVRDSFLRTVDSGTARVALDAQLIADIEGDVQTLAMSGAGWFDFARLASQVDIVTPFGQEIRLCSSNVIFYEKAPAEIRGNFPGDRPWLQFDFDAADRAQYGGPIYVFRTDGGDDPWQMLGALTAVSAVHLAGEDTIGGVETRHYEGSLRLADLVAAGDEETKQGRAEFASKIGIEAVPVEVWLDAAGRVRRLQATVPLTLPGLDGITFMGTGGLEFSEFGTPVETAGPGPDDSDDVTSVIAADGLVAVGQMLGLF